MSAAVSTFFASLPPATPTTAPAAASSVAPRIAMSPTPDPFASPTLPFAATAGCGEMRECTALLREGSHSSSSSLPLSHESRESPASLPFPERTNDCDPSVADHDSSDVPPLLTLLPPLVSTPVSPRPAGTIWELATDEARVVSVRLSLTNESSDRGEPAASPPPAARIVLWCRLTFDAVSRCTWAGTPMTVSSSSTKLSSVALTSPRSVSSALREEDTWLVFISPAAFMDKPALRSRENG